MRILILTTETPHHIFFIKQLMIFNPIVICEKSSKIKETSAKPSKAKKAAD